MILIIIGFSALGILFTSINVSAAELTVDEVIQSTLRNYPKLEEQLQKLKQAQGQVLSSQGIFDPKFLTEGRVATGYYDNEALDVSIEQRTPLWGITVFSGWRIGQGLFPVYDEILETTDAGEVYGGLKIALLRDGLTDKGRTGLAIAKLGSKEENLRNITQQMLFIYQARLHYWKWFIEGQKLQVYQKLLEIAEFRQQAIEELITLGTKPELDRWDNERLIAKREALLIESQQNLQQAALKLSLFYRDQEGNPIVPKNKSLPSLDHILARLNQDEAQSLSPNAIASILQNHPRLKIDQVKIDQAERKLRLAKNQELPALDLGVRLANDLGEGGPDDINTEELKVGLLFEMPLLNRQARGEKKIAALEASRLRISYNFLKEKIKTNIENAIQQSARSRKRVELTERQWILAQRIQQAEQIKFFLGYSDLLAVNLREEFTTNSRVAYLQALLNYQVALANYDLSIAKTPS